MNRAISMVASLLVAAAALSACSEGPSGAGDAGPSSPDALAPSPDASTGGGEDAAGPPADTGTTGEPDSGIADEPDSGATGEADSGTWDEPDSGSGDEPDAQAGMPDGGGMDLPDAAVAGGDATVFHADGSVTGTVLDDLAIQWPQPLELCNVWVEGNDASEELRRKVKVSLEQEQRIGLQPWELAQASVDGVLVERGNLSTQRWRPAPGTIGLSLRKYEVGQTGGATTLQAELAHELGPAVGTLVESYHLYRNGSATSPVVVDGSWTSECSFAMELPGYPEAIQLTACAGSPGFEKAVEILKATRGTRTMVLARFMNTRLAMAGSYPVHTTGIQLAFTDLPWMVQESGDFFAHTYVAEHHNWNEDSVIDFSQEPRLYHSIFRPIAEGLSGIPATPEKIVLNDINGWSSPPTVTITTRNSDNSTTVEVWDASADSGRLVRVDDDQLTRHAAQYCTNPSVFFVGWGIGLVPSFQLVTCPQATPPGYSLKALVPVWFPEEPATIATEITGAAIQPASGPGRSGHTVRVGAHTVTLLTSDGVSFQVDVKNAAGTSISGYVADASELSAYPVPRVETLTGSNASAGVSMTLVRQWAGQGVGESSIYAPLSFSLTFAGQTHLVDGMDQLRYTNSHHNWMDSLEARTDDGLVLRWRNDFMTGIAHEVEVTTEAGVQVLPPTVLQ